MDRKYIQSVKPLTDHVLQVDFISGSRLLLDMKPYLDKFRFRSLSDRSEEHTSELQSPR